MTTFPAPKPEPRPKRAPSELSRRTPLAKRNEDRAVWKYARNFGEWADEIRAMPCWSCGRRATAKRPNEAAHTVNRGMGGCGGDKRTLLPLCTECHTRFDAHRLFYAGRKVTREAARNAAERLWNERGLKVVKRMTSALDALVTLYQTQEAKCQ